MSTSATADLTTLLERARVLMLDFDGPICSIFAGHPAQQIARELLEELRADGERVSGDLDSVTDPFDVLRYAATLSVEAAERTDARLRAAELAAVPSATPTAHAKELITAWRDTGRQVAAVSNNSEAAVTAYLDARRLPLDAIIGRTSADPALLKPNPHLVIRALKAVGVTPDKSVLVGDSPSDVDAARQAGLPTIGYANKPGKRERLISTGAYVVIDHLGALLAAVSGSSWPLSSR